MDFPHVFFVGGILSQDLPKRPDATVTNDGATILKSVWIDNPAARPVALVSISFALC